MNTGGSYNGANSVIQSSQAFFVEGGLIRQGSLVISESSKSTSQRNVFRAFNTKDEKLLINLYFHNADNTITLADAAQTRYNSQYSTDVTAEDAGKPDNIDENVAVVRDGRKLMVERRPPIEKTDTIFLMLYNTKVKKYSFEIDPSNFTEPAPAAYLEDAYLKTSTPVSLSSPTLVEFSITNDVSSANPNRFKIVFKATSTLPVTITGVNAYQKNEGIQVDWSVTSESNVHYYEVEKSDNGQQFAKAAAVPATANNNTAISYDWLDVHANYGAHYYRIKTVENSGAFKYSKVVKVNIENGKNNIVVYPNPSTDRLVFVQMNNQPKGRYTIQMFNHLGQQLINTFIEHPGGSATQKIDVSRIVSEGIYQILISNGKNKINQQIIFN